MTQALTEVKVLFDTAVITCLLLKAYLNLFFSEFWSHIINPWFSQWKQP